ncbi:MAG: biosynthetic arginine decarboxylase [Acidobacteriota bacterium]
MATGRSRDHAQPKARGPAPRRRRASERGPWTPDAARRLYGVDAWGRDSFSVTERGTLAMGPLPGAAPDASSTRPIDLESLVREVVERGIEPPLLLRFSDLLRARITIIHDAFRRAIDDYEFSGDYRGVYPIKVNQNRLLVEDLVESGRPFHYGLEAGSKPELVAVMALLSDPEALVVCNGYKDETYVETALLASRLGPKVILVIEKPAELDLVIRVAERTGIRPCIGMRARLSARGAGHWEASAGDRSKFGLGARELVEAVETLRAAELLDTFELLHFHLGSQISAIRNVKVALREGGWLYVNLKRLGAPLSYFDVGGGLGVDYDGSQTDFVSSMNYTLQEYANDVVSGLIEVCDPAGVEHPTIVTECGRATVAHHAVLVVETLGVSEVAIGHVPEALPDDAEASLVYLVEAYHELEPGNLRETYHDAQHYREDCLNLFNLGRLSLEQRVLADDVFWAICRKTRDLVRDLPYVPPELQGIEAALADTYFCNFSLFQSLPDSWAIDQLFPVVPIHRLDERPTRRGILADITCDSDGKIDRFVRSHLENGAEANEVRPVLELHEPRPAEPYYLGIFLVGAYQEILGDLHNLFGDTNTVHVSLEDDDYVIDHVVAGDTVQEVLAYVEYQAEDLVARVRRLAERAIRRKSLRREEARDLLRRYERLLAGSTYLETGSPEGGGGPA